MGPIQFIIGAIIVLVALLFGGLWAFQTYAIYRFGTGSDTPEELGLAEVRIVNTSADDGTPLRAWVADPMPGKPVIISFYGNYASIGPSMRRLSPLIEKGYGVAVLEYRSSGTAPGVPGEENFISDARVLYDELDTIMNTTIPTQQRIIHGYSLGSSIAVGLAASRDSAALILEATFDRLCRFQKKRLRGFPMCTLMWKERHDVVDRISDIAVPVLIGHGKLDKAIPLGWAEALFEQTPEPKTFKIYEDGTHTNLFEKGMIDDIVSFIEALNPN